MLKRVPHLFGLLNSKQKWQFCSMTILAFLVALAGPVGISFGAPFMASVLRPESMALYGHYWPICDTLRRMFPDRFSVVMALALVDVLVLRALILIFHSSVHTKFLNDNWQLLSKNLFEQFVREDYLVHHRRSTAEIVSTLNEDAKNYFIMLSNLSDILSNVLSVCVLVILLMFSDIFTGAVIMVLFPAILGTLLFFQRRNLLINGVGERDASIQVLSFGSRVMGAWEEIRVQQKASAFVQKYGVLSGEAANWRKKIQTQNNTANTVQNLAVAGAFVLTTVILVLGVNLSKYIPQLMLLLLSLVWLIPVTISVNRDIMAIITGAPGFENLQKIMKQAKKIRRGANPAEPIRFDDSIIIKDLSFSYSDEENALFKSADIIIPAGYTVAVVGKSGIGKTTLVDLILGLIRPQSGHIFYDDTDIAALDNPDLSGIASYVPQITYLNGDSIMNNIAFEEEPDQQRIWHCLERVGLRPMVERLPEGIHTMIGEDGTSMSGGQRQRIAIARALYRDFRLLVMDESMSSLDQDTETAILSSIASIPGKKTLLIITHRARTADMCDIVYRISDQRIFLEKGSYIFSRLGKRN